jgi:LemA protein
MNFFNILLIIIVVIAGYFIAIYNKLVSLRAGIDASWSDIEVQLKKRLNLIPALVETVKGYKDYEADTLQKIVEARNAAANAKSVEEKAKANGNLTKALGTFFALAENYPELKANQNFLDLQDNLKNIEEAIANARRYYNAIVRDYNAKIESFPDLIIAKKFNFTPKEYFELQESEKETAYKMPNINFK